MSECCGKHEKCEDEISKEAFLECCEFIKLGIMECANNMYILINQYKVDHDAEYANLMATGITHSDLMATGITHSSLMAMGITHSSLMAMGITHSSLMDSIKKIETVIEMAKEHIDVSSN